MSRLTRQSPPVAGAASRLATVLILFTTFALADQAAQPTAPAPVQSEAANTQALRDPFWPIGFVPADPETVPIRPTHTVQAPKAAPKISWPVLKISATMLSDQGGYCALISGVGVVKQGQDVSLVSGGVRYRWRIDSISKKSIVPTPLDATPLR